MCFVWGLRVRNKLSHWRLEWYRSVGLCRVSTDQCACTGRLTDTAQLLGLPSALWSPRWSGEKYERRRPTRRAVYSATICHGMSVTLPYSASEHTR